MFNVEKSPTKSRHYLKKINKIWEEEREKIRARVDWSEGADRLEGGSFSSTEGRAAPGEVINAPSFVLNIFLTSFIREFLNVGVKEGRKGYK